MIKDYLGFENSRNKKHAHCYTALLKAGLKERAGFHIDVLVGHHITYEVNGQLETEGEIPSADCLMFDHDIMQEVFGEEAIPLMMRLAALPCEERDKLLMQKVEERLGMVV